MSKACYFDGLCYSGLGDRTVLKEGSLHGIGDREGWREQVFGGPPAPPRPAWTTSLSGSGAIIHPLPGAPLTSCLPFQAFSLVVRILGAGFCL